MNSIEISENNVSDNLLAGDNSSSASSSKSYQDNPKSENLNVNREENRNLNLCMNHSPKNQALFFAQIILIYIIIGVSLSQLILQSTEKELWLVLLSTSIGYILPSPRLKYLKQSLFEDNALNSTQPSSKNSSSLALNIANSDSHERYKLRDRSSYLQV